MHPISRPVPFDAKRAMGRLAAICAIGPRISGTEGMRKQKELIEQHFKNLGAEVEYQKFTFRQVSRRQPTEMANLIVSWHPACERRVILCSHYDTRPIADHEDDPRNWHGPFVSANFPMEGHSARAAAPLVDSVWRVARELNATAFEDKLGSDVYDDHLPLNNHTRGRHVPVLTCGTV